MNWKSTLVIVLLAGAAGVWYFLGDAIVPSQTAQRSAAIDMVESFSPGAVVRVEVASPGEPLIIERRKKAEGATNEVGWKAPGNWPLRKPEVEELVATLGTLRTRFQAIAVPENTDLTPYGLTAEQKPVVVRVVARGRLVPK